MTERILETKRCYLRQLCEADVAQEFELYKSPHMADFMEIPKDYENELALCGEYRERSMTNMATEWGDIWTRTLTG